MSTTPRAWTATRRRSARSAPPAGGRSRARGRRLHLADQLVAHLEQPVGGERGRLLHEVDRTGVERAQHQLARFARDADDDDRHRLARHLLADEPDAVEIRHDQVAGDDVGLQLDDLLERLLAVARRADDFDERAARQHLRDDLPDVGRIVDDEDASHAVCSHQFLRLNVSRRRTRGRDPRARSDRSRSAAIPTRRPTDTPASACGRRTRRRPVLTLCGEK